MPAVTAAIIGAVTTAAATATTELAKLKNSGRPFAALAKNESDLDLRILEQFPANHGQWANSAADRIAPLPTPQTLFEAWKADPNVVKPAEIAKISDVATLPANDRVLFTNWIKNQKLEDNIGTFVLNSRGAGTEGIVVYGDKNSQVALALYFNNPDVGALKAGAFICGFGQMKKDFIAVGFDRIKAHIQDYGDVHGDCAYSDGGTKKALKVAVKGQYTLTFAAAETTTYTITGPE